MEVDLQSLSGLHVTWCAQLYSLTELRPRNSPLPLHLDSYREILVSKDRRHLFVSPWTNPSAAVQMLLARDHFLGLQFSWINKQTRLFIHNERAVFCWPSRLSRLNLGPKRWPLFSLSQYRLYILDGVRRGVRCTLLIRYYFTLNKSSLADW